MSLESMIQNETIQAKKPSLLQRNSSQLLQHASKFSLRRSLTTKVSTTTTSPPIQQPRPSVSFSSASPSYHHHQTVKEYIPPPPFTSPVVIDTSLTLNSVSDNRILSPIPENRQQSLFEKQRNQPHHYSAFLSSIAYEFKRRIILSDRIKNGIEYHNIFDGKEAVDKLKEIIGTTDRLIALRVGRALESQRFFHDVNYENRLLDEISEIYQFHEMFWQGYNSSHNSSSSNGSYSVTSTVITDYYDDEFEDESNSSTTFSPQSQTEEDEVLLPNGIYTELTHCYTPTCRERYPCYSYTCPKRERMRRRPHSVDTREKRVTAYLYEVEKHQLLWSQTVDEYIVLATPSLERKRQETIFELIYTEEDFLSSLDYVIKMWIEPLKKEDIIPKERRDEFIDQVFSNWTEIRNISRKLSGSLRARQLQHPIVSHISDIMETYVSQFEPPFLYYGARQHQAKHIFERERYNNPRFAIFAERTERDIESRKLELNGYLTKPTTRLGRYTLLLDKIQELTAPNHPDKEHIPYIIHSIKDLLQKVNVATGVAKNRFDLELIQAHLTFRNKKDRLNLRLLEKNRLIIKQGVLRKTPSMESTGYQVILFDHYLVTAKVKVIHAVEHYSIQKRPIPIELLGVNFPLVESTVQTPKCPVAVRIGPDQTVPQETKQGLPITFYHQGSNAYDTFTLYAATELVRKSWNTAIQKQREIKFKRKPVFDIVDTVKRYEFFAEIAVHQMVIFDQGRSYMLATDAGVYVGPYNSVSGIPRKILPIERVSKVHVFEDYQLLLVLADQVLWQYPLGITLNGQDQHSILNFGRKIRQNVPFFHVGNCLDQTLICVPRQFGVRGSEIDLFEPTMPKTEMKKKSLLGRLSIRSSTSLSLTNTQVVPLKPVYSPYDVWAIDTTKSLMLLTTPIGIIAIDMKTKKPDALLDPLDKYLQFITKFEKVDTQMTMNPSFKRISVFPVPDGNYLVCYNKYAFYIDKKGRRARHKFKIEWEGHPTSFAYHHPHVIAFEHHFIEIRSVIDGHLEQVIQEKNVYCLQNGHKTKEKVILGTMIDKSNSMYQHIFELQPVQA